MVRLSAFAFLRLNMMAGPLAHIALLHRLPDVVEGHRPVDVDEFVVLAQHVEELAEVLVWQYVISNLGLWGQRRGQQAVSWLPRLLGWPIKLPERMHAGRASSSGETR